MKTLVIIGAVRRDGRTRQMVGLFLEHLDGEKEIIGIYHTEIKPCVDCRLCWRKKECVIEDGIQGTYQRLKRADNIILASSMYFYSITGRVKSLVNHFQVYRVGHVRDGIPEIFLHKNAILMVGGAPSSEDQFLGGEIVLKNLLNDLSTECLSQVCLPNNDRGSLETEPDVAAQVVALTEKMNWTVK